MSYKFPYRSAGLLVLVWGMGMQQGAILFEKDGILRQALAAYEKAHEPKVENEGWATFWSGSSLPGLSGYQNSNGLGNIQIVPRPSPTPERLEEQRAYDLGFTEGLEFYKTTLAMIRRNEKQLGRELTDEETRAVFKTRMDDLGLIMLEDSL